VQLRFVDVPWDCRRGRETVGGQTEAHERGGNFMTAEQPPYCNFTRGNWKVRSGNGRYYRGKRET